jgi:4-amino-4-deoxy-L-arabinose transferase-like glycosyltransferase
MGYLSAVWHLFGYQPATTRCAMLFLASLALLSAFLLARELLGQESAWSAAFAAFLLCVSPLFFAQSMMAQLDAPAMLFTTVALWLFLRDRLVLCAVVCVVLVLVKETGIVTPLVCAIWLARERRWSRAALFLAPPVALAFWVAAIAVHTGHLTGNSEFARYNLYEPLQPVRIVVTLLRRLYYILGANFHWIGTTAIIVAWRGGPVFQSRSWRVAASLVAAHALMFSVLGGAVLERYLLPAMPIVYAAMAAALWQLGRPWKLAGSAALIAGLIAANFINPIYAFPLEDNLAYTDYLAVHAEAAKYLADRYPNATVATLWPMTAELAQPDFGFADRPIRARLLPDLSPATLGSLDWGGVQVLAAFPRDLPQPRFWKRFLPHPAGVTRAEVRGRVPFPPSMQFERRGQWVDIYVNPRPCGILAAACGIH